ncbi:MAG: hypothetical protein ACLPPV_05915, partial [Candidatus Korobacteraceae bacterium]
ARLKACSTLAWAEISTRKAMFPAHCGKKISGGTSASLVHVLMASAYAFNRTVEVLPLPFQISR